MMHIIRVIESGFMKGSFPESSFETKEECEKEIEKIESKLTPAQRNTQHFEIMTDAEFKAFLG